MAIELKESEAGKILEVFVTGKLEKEDYATFVPAVEQAVAAHGKIRMLVVMHDFHGWTASAAWEDTKFGARHFRDLDRLAMVGETRWQHGMAVFCKPFTSATVRYFPHEKTDEARAWLSE
jgi:alkanesulfonate monooxygenase SsuD/methylene tetrahydromethanopterin reductase-like flavin-dependent oxidoreductase (luciferase family)